MVIDDIAQASLIGRRKADALLLIHTDHRLPLVGMSMANLQRLPGYIAITHQVPAIDSTDRRNMEDLSRVTCVLTVSHLNPRDILLDAMVRMSLTILAMATAGMIERPGFRMQAKQRILKTR